MTFLHKDKGELVEIVDYVKVDFRASDPAERQEIYKMFGKKTIFLAEKVETLAEVRAAQAEGNTLFQGYFHARPEIIAEAQISPPRPSICSFLLRSLILPWIREGSNASY